MSIRVVTDSSADLPPDLARQWDITVIPCNVIIDDVAYKDGVDLTADQFYQRLAAGPRPPTTAQPSTADFGKVYQELLDQGHQVISIHLSRKLSGTLNSAEQARASLAPDPPIEIVDSGLASLGLGLVAMSAARLARERESVSRVAEQVILELPLTQAYFVLDTLEYLRRGGRIGKARAFMGSLLSVKPILKIEEGEAHPVERPRNFERAVRRLVELVGELAPVREMAVLYSTEEAQALDLRARLSGLLPEEEIIVGRFGPSLGTYTGPKALGIAVTSARS